MLNNSFSLFRLGREPKPLSTRKQPCNLAELSQVKHAKEFRMVFTKIFCAFGDDAISMAKGTCKYEHTRGEKIVEGGVAIASVATGSMISILAMVGVIGGVASQGIGLGVAVLGMALGNAISAYNDNQKKKNFERTSGLFDDGRARKYAVEIANLLVDACKDDLNRSTKVEARVLARLCMKKIEYAFANGKVKSLQELLKFDVLTKLLNRHIQEDTLCQGVGVVRSHIRKRTLKSRSRTNLASNSRSFVLK